MNLPFDEFRKNVMVNVYNAKGGDIGAINRLGTALEAAMSEGIDLVQWVNPKVFPLIVALHEELGVEVRARSTPQPGSGDGDTIEHAESEHIEEAVEQPESAAEPSLIDFHE